MCKEGKELNSAAEKLEFQQNAHTRYYVRVTVTDDKGETAVSEPAYFETGKMEEPWVGKWITTEKEDTFHPLFVKSFEAKKGLASARLYICGLGLFTAELKRKKSEMKFLHHITAIIMMKSSTLLLILQKM